MDFLFDFIEDVAAFLDIDIMESKRLIDLFFKDD